MFPLRINLDSDRLDNGHAEGGVHGGDDAHDDGGDDHKGNDGKDNKGSVDNMGSHGVVGVQDIALTCLFLLEC